MPRAFFARALFASLAVSLLASLPAFAEKRLAVLEFTGGKKFDVRVKQIDLPPEVSESVFRRMNAEREKEARERRSQGKELAEGIRAAADRGDLPSVILWGPPGTGKTTLARMIARTTSSHFIALSAVMAGVKDIRAAVEQARTNLKRNGINSIAIKQGR